MLLIGANAAAGLPCSCVALLLNFPQTFRVVIGLERETIQIRPPVVVMPYAFAAYYTHYRLPLA